MLSVKHPVQNLDTLIERISTATPEMMSETKYLAPLFESQADYDEFRARHDRDQINRADLSQAKGKVYLGIDAGSTTTKAALIDENKNLLYSFYKGNEGKPIDATITMLRELYKVLPAEAHIAKATVTGYGEGLVQAA